MNTLIPASLLVFPATLMLLLILPSFFLNRHRRIVRQVVTLLTGLQFIVSVAGLAALASGVLPAVKMTLVYYDGISALMFTLISFVGWIVSRYSIRYLDGELAQGRYYRWMGVTIGAVSLMVLSGNLLVFVCFWVMTSLALHQLLTHYHERPAAQRAAWNKFTVSRVGDAALVGAIAALYQQFGALNFETLLADAGANAANPATLALAAFLLVLGAATKSAQFPFHSWLPQTMETPTPVSALMHAGVVNAGGFLIIRMSPIVAESPTVLAMLAVIGGVTACFGAVIMLTQSSVKRALAYSTIAQMGFMMLQCGIGAYTAAMLHIVAHSLYKAHAFLASGSVLQEKSAMEGAVDSTLPVSWRHILGSAGLVFAMLGFVFYSLGIDPLHKPGGMMLAAILGVAMTQWFVQAMRTGSYFLMGRTLMAIGGLFTAYAAAYLATDFLVAPTLPEIDFGGWQLANTILVVSGFLAMFGLHLSLARSVKPQWLNRLQIHASNGFYFEAIVRRVFGSLLTA